MLREGTEVAIAAAGAMAGVAAAAADILAGKGKSACVIDARFVKPLDRGSILSAARRTGRIVTIEENSLEGGFGSAVLELLDEARLGGVETERFGIGDCFVEQGGRWEIMAALGLDAAAVAARIMERFWPS